MSNAVKSKPSGNVVYLKDRVKKPKGKRELVLSLLVYSEPGARRYSYSMEKHGQKKITDDLAAFGLTCVISDVLSYCGNPENVLELTQEIIERLGFERGDNEDAR